MMRVFLLILLFFCSFYKFSIAQTYTNTTKDSLFASRLMQECVVLTENKQYDLAFPKADSAQHIFEKMLGRNTKQVADAIFLKALSTSSKESYKEALAIYEKILPQWITQYGKNAVSLADIYDHIADIYANQGKYDKAIENQQLALNIQLDILGDGHLKVARSYNGLANCFMFKGEYDHALNYYQKTLKIRTQQLGENNLLVANVLSNIGNIYQYKSQYLKATVFYQKALAIRQKLLPPDHPDIASSWLTLGILYLNKGDYDVCTNYTQKALDIYLKNYGNSHVNVAKALHNMGNCYNNKGEYDKAIECLSTSLDIKEKLLGSENPLSSVTLIALGFAYYSKGDAEHAIDYYKKALFISKKIKGINHPDVATALRNIGTCYLYMGEYDKAIEYFQEALDIRLKVLDNKHIQVSVLLDDIALAYNGKKDYDKAIEYAQQALSIKIELFGKNHPDVATSLSNLGAHHAGKRDYQKAIDFYQKAFQTHIAEHSKAKALTNIVALKIEIKDYAQGDSLFRQALDFYHFTSRDSLKSVNLINGLIKTLTEKAKFEAQCYQETKDRKCLLSAAQTYQDALAAIKFQNQTLSSDDAKVFLKKENYTVFEAAIKTNLLFHDKQHDQEAFDLNEQSKATLLRAHIQENNALHYGNIPDSLLQKEYNLRIGIAWREKQRQIHLDSGKIETDSSLLDLSVQIFDLKEQHKCLKQMFEQKYPNYYHLKYEVDTFGIATIQQKWLTPAKTLVSYFVGDQSIFAFVIRQDTFAVVEIKKDFPLEKWVAQLRDGLYGYHNATTTTEKLYETKANIYADAACHLYEKIFAPFASLCTKQLVIVPDGVLSYVPFDALLTAKPADATKFKNLAYLAKNHIISYNYSVALWQEMCEKQHQKIPKGNFIGFAPYYSGDTTTLNMPLAYGQPLRKDLDSLKYSGQEIYKAQRSMGGGETIFDKDATKTVFEKKVSDYRIVHLATHGKANDKRGAYCFLAFATSKDSDNFPFLYVHDIYNLSLNADMIVLSACETGIGELKKGEGMVSLARAFAYAGAKSIVTTLWNIKDKSTMIIAEDFYRQLKKGNSKDFALWNSKWEYIKKAKHETAHPFFWSAFISIGNMQPLTVMQNL